MGNITLEVMHTVRSCHTRYGVKPRQFSNWLKHLGLDSPREGYFSERTIATLDEYWIAIRLLKISTIVYCQTIVANYRSLSHYFAETYKGCLMTFLESQPLETRQNPIIQDTLRRMRHEPQAAS